jgi:uncharacterized membrane protein
MSAGSTGSGAAASRVNRGIDARVVAIAGVMLAVVFVMTRSVTFSIGPAGYVHVGDVGIYVAAFLFGPIVALIAGGGGTALADLSLGYGQWAPGTLVVHGLQAFVAAYIGWRGGLPRMIMALVAGGAIVVVGYFLYMLIFIPAGVLDGEEGKSAFAVSLASVWPNTFQVLLASVIALPLVLAVQRAYPPITRFGAGQTWEEK